MDDETIILRLGGVTAVADSLGLKRSRVSNWPSRGIPAGCRYAVFSLARRKGLVLDEAAFMRTPAVDQPERRAARRAVHPLHGRGTGRTAGVA